MGTKVKVAIVAALTVISLTGAQGIAQATHESPQPALDPSRVDYTPMGYYGPADERNVPAGQGSDTIPTTPPQGSPPANDPGPNPSGKWVAYDTNVWESLNLPSRHPGDNCNSLAPDQQHSDCREGDRDVDNDGPKGYTGPSGAPPPKHGECPPPPASEPEFAAFGECVNHQLEYLDYFENAMGTELADFGVTIKRYGFESPGGGLPRGAYLAAAGGQAYNIAAVVPGADHPEQTVLVSGHYDFTDSGPAAAWDSAEGHTEVMRMAYIMADYWRKTGTRPSATIKFIPWDSEESGTFGSADYVQNNIPPGETDKVRGYFNVDPCAGAYPAFGETLSADGDPQVDQVMQLANPANFPAGSPTRARIESFNARAETIIDEVLDRLDDTLTRPGGVEVPIFVSNAEAANGNDGVNPVTGSDRGKINTAVGGLALFTSDYRNFEQVGIPIFNFFPDYFGPHADDSPSDGGGKGLEILHTPQDNLTRINQLTSGLTTAPGNAIDPSGLFASEGWAKGQEFCAQVESWYMLQPEMAGTQTGNTNAVAYFEALPNEAIQNQAVTFDASGSYQYSEVPDTDPSTPTPRQPSSALTYTWDFGDGTPPVTVPGTDTEVEHGYSEIGRYNATLTVTGVGGSMDTMTIPITVIGSNFPAPELQDINDADAADGQFALNWDFSATRDGFEGFRVEESKDFQTLLSDNASDISLKWEVSEVARSEADEQKLKEWQHSDSETPKFRENEFHSPPRSFWTGVSPSDFNPGVQNANSLLTLKDPITVPSTGEPALDFFSLFLNESDDRGRIEVALVDSDGNVGEFQALDVVGGSQEEFLCSPTNPDLETQPLAPRHVPLDGFKGKRILIRFNYQLGPSNPALSQPCGWYIDDVRVTSGSFQSIGETPADQESFQIDCRPNGTYGYRVKGVYEDGVTTAASNVETAQVTDAKPDVSPTGIRHGAAPTRNKRTTLRATVESLACSDAVSVVVRFFDNRQQIGRDKTIPLVPADGTGFASVKWRPRTAGRHTITVVVDPNDAIDETNEDNNTRSRVMTVRRR
ncbi:MAG: M28 family peptidase [Actinomycetota bacterium]|nr:M28 family peptidase [Actinomycetota bacterium]